VLLIRLCRTRNAIRTAFKAAGVVFANGDEPGVKLQKPDL